jgi:acetyltransferase-like isoleucine patch superfamily enzyme
MIFKFFWIIRGILYKPFFGKFGILSYIGKPIYIKNFKKIFIGNKVRIFPNSRIECIGENAKVVINDNVSIGHNLHITARSLLEISKNCTISSNVLITDDQHDYKDLGVHILDQKSIVKKTFIGENCFIGTGAVINSGTILGKQCVVGANTVTKGLFPDYCVIVGTPGKIVKRYNENTKQWKKTDLNGQFINE